MNEYLSTRVLKAICGSPRGAECTAACWANSRKVPPIAFKPDCTRHAKAAPFKREDAGDLIRHCMSGASGP